MFIFILISISLTVSTLVILYNFFTAPVLKQRNWKRETCPLVSVLIPVRNEEGNIDECLESIRGQSYRSIEIIVYNDQSTDKSREILEKWRQKEDRLSWLDGRQPPSGWVPKNWGCHNLSLQAKGDYLLFMDADVRLNKWAIESALDLMYAESLKALSCFPTQQMRGFSEQLVTPIMNWLLLNFLPLRLVYASANRSFVAANGQFMMFQKESYRAAASHQGQYDKIVEDMELARALKNRGQKIMTLLGGEGVFCRMYATFNDAVNGFTKNFFQGFQLSYAIFSLMLTFFLLVYLMPFIFVFFDRRYIYLIGLILFGRGLIANQSRQSLLISIIFHPFQMVLMAWIGLLGMIQSTGPGYLWKGRRIA